MNPALLARQRYDDTILGTPGLVAYWRLADRSGAVARDECGVNHGTYVDTPTLGAAGLLVDDPDTAVTFNGTSEYVSTPAAISAVMASTLPFSLLAWISHTPDALYRCIFGSYTAGTPGGVLLTSQSGILFFDRATNADDLVSGDALTAGRHFLAATYDSTTMRLYVDGVSVGTPLASSKVIPAGLAFVVGSTPTTYSPFNGTIGKAAVFNRALSASEIAERYNLGLDR